VSDYGLTSYLTRNNSFQRWVFLCINCSGTENQKQGSKTLHTPKKQKKTALAIG